MNALIWILQGLLAFTFMTAGGLKFLRSKDRIAANRRMGWAQGLSAAQGKLLGAAEVVGALGVVEPWATGIVPVLTPVAAACLFGLMVGAAVVHARRKEPAMLPVALSVVAAIVAVARSVELAKR
jgi:uncharacterized membrane protein YphA (DoxX/SURF4 family)